MQGDFGSFQSSVLKPTVFHTALLTEVYQVRFSLRSYPQRRNFDIKKMISHIAYLFQRNDLDWAWRQILVLRRSTSGEITFSIKEVCEFAFRR